METVVVIIMIAAAVSFIIKLTYHSPWGMLLLSLIAGGWVVMTFGFAAEQSKTQISDWLQTPGLMLDTSVWLTADVAFQICFCILCACKLCGALKGRERIFYAICLWVPGLLIFPVLFALLTEVIFSLPGTDFAVIGWSLGVAISIAGPALAFGIKYLFPEPEIRVELLFMINVLIGALGIVATVNGRTATAGTNSVEWAALGAVITIVTAGACAGFFISRRLAARKTANI